jgi:hypothetical protein
MINRRDMLATTVAGGSTLALGGMGVGTAHAQVVPPVQALDAATLAVLRVMVPNVLGNRQLPTSSYTRASVISQTAQRAGELVNNYPPVNKATMISTLGYLVRNAQGVAHGPQGFVQSFAPAYGVSLPATWEAMTYAQLSHLLEYCRKSSDPAYGALHRGIFSTLIALIPNAFYSNPTNWAAIGYPGPPKLA